MFLIFRIGHIRAVSVSPDTTVYTVINCQMIYIYISTFIHYLWIYNNQPVLLFSYFNVYLSFRYEYLQFKLNCPLNDGFMSGQSLFSSFYFKK